MIGFKTTLLSVAGATLFAISTASSASAAALPSLAGTSAVNVTIEDANVQQAHYRGRHRHFHNRNFRNRHFAPRYRGYRGHRRFRRGFRRHGGYWYPPAAFFSGSVIIRPAPRRNITSLHHRWCYDRYRSYRAWDGTYQPYGHRPRALCNSPYDGR